MFHYAYKNCTTVTDLLEIVGVAIGLARILRGAAATLWPPMWPSPQSKPLQVPLSAAPKAHRVGLDLSQLLLLEQSRTKSPGAETTQFG